MSFGWRWNVSNALSGESGWKDEEGEGEMNEFGMRGGAESPSPVQFVHGG
jgi:hypothetical protein